MRSHKSRATAFSLIAVCTAAVAHAQSGRQAEQPYTTWRTYGGGGHASQYSALDQINKSNVTQLAVAWSFPVGERSFVFNPIVVDDVMYVLARDNDLVALGCGYRARALGAPARRPGLGPRHQLLAERGRQRPPAALLELGVPDGARRAHGPDDHDASAPKAASTCARLSRPTAGTSAVCGRCTRATRAVCSAT